jgi:hypothetical protein
MELEHYGLRKGLVRSDVEHSRRADPSQSRAGHRFGSAATLHDTHTTASPRINKLTAINLGADLTRGGSYFSEQAEVGVCSEVLLWEQWILALRGYGSKLINRLQAATVRRR